MPEPGKTNEGLYRLLSKPDCGPLPRIAASLAAGLALSAIVPFGVALICIAKHSRDLDDEVLLTTIALAGIAWLLALRWIWRGYSREVQYVRAAALTATVACVAVILGVVVAELFRSDHADYLIVSLILLSSAIAVAIWIPVAVQLVKGRTILRDDGVVNVTCPKCGYLLVGLTELRCPECGTQFTIDGLIRAQKYSSHPA